MNAWAWGRYDSDAALGILRRRIDGHRMWRRGELGVDRHLEISSGFLSVSTATLEEATQRTWCVRLAVSVTIRIFLVGSPLNLGQGNDHVSQSPLLAGTRRPLHHGKSVLHGGRSHQHSVLAFVALPLCLQGASD